MQPDIFYVPVHGIRIEPIQGAYHNVQIQNTESNQCNQSIILYIIYSYIIKCWNQIIVPIIINLPVQNFRIEQMESVYNHVPAAMGPTCYNVTIPNHNWIDSIGLIAIWYWHITLTSQSVLIILPMETVRSMSGPHLNLKTNFPCMMIPIINIKRLRDRLIDIIGFPILVRGHLYIQTVSWFVGDSADVCLWKMCFLFFAWCACCMKW